MENLMKALKEITSITNKGKYKFKNKKENFFNSLF